MVKIPELTEDGQNWKIYRAKLLEVAATRGWLCMLAGEPFDRTYDWQGYDALLHKLFNATVPINIYVRLCRNTAHQVFKYLMKRFHDREPIPCANEFQCAGTAGATETPEKSPTSDIAATEWHADTNLDVEDLSNSTTKALTRGTEDVDDRNIGHMEDPHTSFEALAKGIGTEHSEMTPVILMSAPHETQNQPHSSLPLTPRLPIDGEPCKCKQEVVDSIVMAGCTNGMVELAKPTEMVMDVDRTAPLDGEPAEMACGVDEGDEMEHEPQT